MRGIVVAFAFLTSLATAAQAQQPPAAPNAPKDRKDYLMEALESQRNDSLAKLAICYADANGQIASLNTQLAATQAELNKLKAPAPTPPAPAPPAAN